MHQILEDLTWRYATKKFDSEKVVSDENFEVLKESLRLTPSSYGLQPLQFVVVENKSIRNLLVAASFGQSQVQDASHLIVICVEEQIDEALIDSYVSAVIDTRNVDPDRIINYANYMKKIIGEMSHDERITWASKQAYIALGQLLHTCATMRIDATPMEGFDASRYVEILDLGTKKLRPVLVCPIGYRHESDSMQHEKKVRRDSDKLFMKI